MDTHELPIGCVDVYPLLRRAAHAAMSAVESITPELSASVSALGPEPAPNGPLVARVLVQHSHGGKGTLVLRLAYGYLYLDRGASDQKVPTVVLKAAFDAVDAIANDSDMRSAQW